MIRKAKAVWHGTGRDGSGNLSSESGVLAETPYSFKTRFENEKGTNPEELIAAAHAGCFTMALAFGLQLAGFYAGRSCPPKPRSRSNPKARDSGSASQSSPCAARCPISTTPGLPASPGKPKRIVRYRKSSTPRSHLTLS